MDIRHHVYVGEFAMTQLDTASTGSHIYWSFME